MRRLWRAAGAGCTALMLVSLATACDDENPETTARTATLPAPRTVATAPASAAPAPAPEPSNAPRKPPIISRPIPFDEQRRRDMTAYSERHYGVGEHRLLDPKVIVEHFTVNDSVEATYNTFAPNVADPELRELPGVCSHFVIGVDGRIYQFVSLRLRCRHAVGLNDRSLAIEHVGRSDAEILNRPAQLTASLRLTAWLRCRYAIAVHNVIGHNESRSSPYHHEDVERLRTQTHGDFAAASMQIYRRKLRDRPCA